MDFFSLQKSKWIRNKRAKSKYNFDNGYEYRRYLKYQDLKRGNYREWKERVIAENSIFSKERTLRDLENFKRYCLQYKRNYEMYLKFYEPAITFSLSSFLTLILVFVTLIFEAMKDEWRMIGDASYVIRMIAESSTQPYVTFAVIVVLIIILILYRKIGFMNHIYFYNDIIEIVDDFIKGDKFKN